MLHDPECGPEHFVKSQRLDGRPQLGAFKNKHGVSLSTYGWLVKNAIGIIILIHGLNSHVRFSFLRHNVDIVGTDKAILKDGVNYYVYKDSWVERFNKSGYSVYGIDLQGHGKSGGWGHLRANIRHFDDMVHDVLDYIMKIQENFCGSEKSNNILCCDDLKGSKKSIPVYIIGQSMGGNIALRTLQLIGKMGEYNEKKLNIKGCISLSGMISIERLVASPRSYKYKYIYLPIIRLFSYCFPRFRIVNNMRYIKYKFMNDLFKYDKMRYNKGITSRFACELLKAMGNLDRDMQYIPEDIPILFIHSKDDTLCYYRGVVSFFKRLKNDNKELLILENMEHMLTVEPGNETVLSKIMNWLSKLTSEIKNANLNKK
ncbi:PST-A protein [Plasmodium gonderi]|uniref:PST-A protein n=1 Tax=Plasmodium gonderi TaxID=77519 RepID=A0A1Y1JLW5_PLAGO|nr:PST-A protein [Plasmodium gonderi]GAW83210.1 PST-A protein [Plasmodium gonderi]